MRDIIEDQYSLSPMQQGMLFHALFDQRRGLYVDHAVFDFPDHALNVDAFRRAWQRVVDRHPSLRASFHWKGLDAPVQRIHANVDLSFEVEDWRHLSMSDREHRLEIYRTTDRDRGFTLTEAPLMRWRVFRLGDDHFRCLWTIHHLLADGRSALVILREVFALYEAFSRGSDVQWPVPPSFREHVSRLDRQDRQAAESFWRKTLQGFTAPTPLVVDRPSDSRFDGSPIEREMRLRPETTAALKALADRHLLSLGTFVQGAWALLLSRYSGEEDVVFGAVRSCRRSSIEGAESIVGVFMNTVPIRVRVPWDASLVPWLKGLRLQQVPLLRYEHTPLVDVQRWSDLPARTPLFESVLDFADFSLDATLRELGSLWHTSTLKIHEKTNFALTIYAAAEPDLTIKIAFDPTRFEDDAIRRMLGHLETLFEAMAAQPNQRLGDLPLLTPAEERQLLVEWNDTRVEYPRHACIHQLFEAQVERTPDGIALCFEDRRLTYRELNRRANQLARRLGNAGVCPGARVGVSMERSLDLMVGLLGILKAGAAYVPLDPSFPKDRLRFIIDDAAIGVLVTQERLARALGNHELRSICIDTDSSAIAHEPGGNLETSVSSDDLAYVMYTSGSTGQPKGVRVRHRNVVNFFAGMDAAIDGGRPGVWLAVTSISFDISVLELFWTLTRGFKVIVHSAEETAAAPAVRSFYSIPAQIAAHGVTHFQCTPSMARMLSVRSDSLRGLAPLRTMLVGGEALPADLADQLQHFVSGEILNMYGPTETTIWSTTAVVERDRRPVPIGRPIANTQTYILDRRCHPVPVGVPGELFIAGDGVAAGYHHRPTLTADRFVENPFSTEPDGKMYRTGDVARYCPDGAIEFLGRVDHQVKIRGHRIELGEIEAVLQRHPGVAEAVVVAREDHPGDQRLVGYVVPLGPQTITNSELRAYSSGKLPKEMVPAVCVIVDSLPRTPNGKLDRRALPAPDHARQDTQRVFVAPRDRVESELTRMWERILSVHPIGVTDSFFELGGHSLLAVSLFAQIEKTFGKTLPLATLFEGPTIEQLAAILQRDVPSSSSPLVCIQPHGSRPPLFFMHAEGGNVLEYYPLARCLGTDQPFYALQSDLLNGHDSPSVLRLEDMAARYIREIRNVQPTGPYFLGGWCLGGYLAYEAAQQLRAQGEDVALLAMIQTAFGDYGRRRPGLTYFHRLFYRLMKRVDLEWYNVAALAPNARLRHLASRAKRLRTIAQLKSETLLDPWLARLNVREWHSLAYRLEAVGKYHVQAALSYRPKPYQGRVTLFRATKQPLDIVPDRTMGWGMLLNGPVEIHDVPAHHQNIMIEPRVRLLARQLAACVDRARKERRSELPRTA
jgi:amino acid adenylation domain-containing protein